MKRLVALITCLVLGLFSMSLIGCAGGQPQSDNGTVSVKYFSAATEMLPALKQGQLSIGLLPEPAATQLTKMANDKTWYRLDVQALYDEETKAYPQAVVMVKESFLNTYPNAVDEMANAFGANVEWVKQNTADAVAAVNAKVESGLTPSLKAENITEQVVDNCKIYWQGAEDSKESVKGYLNDCIAVSQDSAVAVGDEFFYAGQASGEFTADTVKVFAPDGAPALAIAKFINDNEDFGTNKTFEYTVVSSSNIGPKVATGAGDIVIIPVNAASKLYNKNASAKYKLAGVITHGNLYIMSSVPFVTLADKTIGVIGQGLVPDLTLKTILNKNKINVKIAA
ncbi:MAG: hypothetical protein E7369_06045 [Clostridiales bacterium]|nr:hypothetical protein [Clostridiales bacterium]